MDFTRDIRPILAANCFACHGPDEESREAKLRLDTQAGSRADLDGHAAIVPGKPAESELYRRLTTDDPDDRMPPRKTGKTLNAAQVQLLQQWIAGGGEYEQHWAFARPKRPPVPAVRRKAWPRNPIDYFVLARLEKEGLSPTAEADRYALVRRLYLDLIGLPPTPAQADAFVNDADPKAYENMVDQLLKSPHYGERWARPWLDLARYADTNGYEKDRPRSIWPYRDWVIRALNDDMPFDRFTVEQLAGDMLPQATEAQRVATGFHRNTMINEEGGIDPLEYRFYAMVDRVATTGTVWMGLTTGCAQCHSHKYDPISHTDYYRLMALLNNADEPDLSVPEPAIAKRRAQVESQIAALEADLPNQFPPAAGSGPESQRRKQHLQQKFAQWVKQQQPTSIAWTVLRPTDLKTNLPRLGVQPDGSILSTGDITKRDVFDLRFSLRPFRQPVTALRLEVLPDDRLPARGPGRAYYEGRKGDFFLSEVTAKAAGQPIRFGGASHDYGKISIGSGKAKAENVFDGKGSTGWSTSGREGKASQLVLVLAKPLAPGGDLDLQFLFERHFAASLGRFRISATSSTKKVAAKSMPVEIESILAQDESAWTADQRATVQRHFLGVTPELAKARKAIDQLRRQLPAFPMTMVMLERPKDNPRPTFRHHRGEYLQPKERVTPGLPALFPAPPDGPPTDRLALARWLVSESNPLGARVTVNRSWQAIFGRGLVETSGDFGTQANPPSHPQLLDWLARKLIEQGWSLKAMHRLIVTSATYRQDSRITPTLLQRDAGNRLLARGPRHRVDAETVRDIALTASGLLSTRVGGPSVYPPQPASVTALAYGGTRWKPSSGPDRYRRSLYTFAKRTAPFAAYTVFDGPTGENCIARRDRSNTPLQALTLLNDNMFLEMARALAERGLAGEGSTSERATLIFRRCVTRPPGPNELAALVDFYQAQKRRLDSSELKATDVGGRNNASASFAAWT
ncbi:MAG: PSD1 and planctomycete cytochrome C domain-containing protein, partial [Phycisphaerae bacterium]|nr:PSD1 and planctomycete cytochrome C domain-containing protein [Phycisphaerae bacterium]